MKNQGNLVAPAGVTFVSFYAVEVGNVVIPSVDARRLGDGEEESGSFLCQL